MVDLEKDSAPNDEIPDWPWLVGAAKGEVETLIAGLPDELRPPAQKLPVYFEPRPDPSRHPGIESDTLGLFVGNPLAETHLAHGHLAAHILLFLENHWNGDAENYKEEVRITYLHELGHYLGLEEEDLDERGL